MGKIDINKCEFCYTVSCQHLCMIGANDTRYNDECIENPNCYYKQLQQLKESNKTLNEMLLILNNRLDEYKRIYGEL